MLTMIQRVFYGHLGATAGRTPARDLTAREQTAVWPLIAMMVVMGIASPYWFKTLDANASALAIQPAPHVAEPVRAESETYTRPPAAQPVFLDPKLAADALHKPAPTTLQGARY